MSHGTKESGADIMRNFMRQLPQAVLVVTTTHEGTQWGLTMSSATSASLDPPLFLICVDRKAASFQPILKRGAFVVNLLHEDQVDISDLFAGRFKSKEKFRNVKFHLSENGLPIIDRALGYLECEAWKNFEAGDHEIIIGKVTKGESRSGSPIVYYDQSYAKVGKWEAVSSVYPPSF